MVSFSRYTENKSPFHPPPLFDPERDFTHIVNMMTADEKRNILHILKCTLKDDKRQRLRKRQNINARLMSDTSHRGHGVIENLSHGGAFLRTRRRLPPGSDITLSFPVLNFEFPAVMKAQVVWISHQGMGLKFSPTLKLESRLHAQKIADALGDS